MTINPATKPSIAEIIDATPMGLPRAKGPSLAAAVDAARTAAEHGTARNVKVTVMITDSAGDTVVLVSGDGASARSQLIARTKANIVLKYGMTSGEVQTRAKTDPELAAEIKADPNIGVARGGGFPVVKDGELFAVVAVSGAVGFPELDDECAMVAVDRLLAS